MKVFTVLMCLCCFAACTSVQQVAAPEITPPQLLMQHPLPVIPKWIYKRNLKLDMYILVAEDGSVKNVRLHSGIGIAEWDSLAVTVIRQWRYSPARINNRPVRLWLHQASQILLSDPVYISLGAILCSTPEEAESIYTALEQGDDFNALAEKYSAGSRNFGSGIIGEVDIHSYPKEIQDVLLELDTDLFSRPVKYGEHYAIFKRLKEQQ